MSFLSLTPLALIIALPIAICVLDNVIRILAVGLGNAVSSESMIMSVVFVGLAGNYFVGGKLLSRLGQDIAGLFDQIVFAL